MRTVALALAAAAGLVGLVPPVQAQGDSPKDLPSALEYLKSDKPTDRAFALSVMGLLGGDAASASKQVVQAYFDSSPDVRGAASMALKNVNPTLYGPVQTLTATDTSNPMLYQTQLQTLKNLSNLGTAGDAALPALIAFLPRMQPRDQAQMVQTIAAVGAKDPEATAMLGKLALESNNPAVRDAAVKALPKMADAGAQANLFAATLRTARTPDQKAQAIAALGAVGKGNRGVLTTIQGYLADPSPKVREAAQKALKALKSNGK